MFGSLSYGDCIYVKLPSVQFSSPNVYVYDCDNPSTLFPRFQKEVQTCGISLSSSYRKPSYGNVLSVNSSE